MTKRIPVIVVSGFLGSGKTTFLKYLIKNIKKNFGLLINEFGDVGIDGDLIKSCSSCNTNSEKCVIELNNGTNLMVTNLYDFDVTIEDNKKVWVRYESVEMPNMCICGQVVTIDDLQER